MAQGKPTSAEKLAEFRAHYLLSGNAAESAAAVGIPERTGQDHAAKLNTLADFAEDRRVLRASYLDECVNARMAVMRKAKARALADEPDFYPQGDGLTVVDKRKEWADVVLSAEKNAHNLARISSGNSEGHERTEVHVHLAPEKAASDVKAS